MPTHAHYWPETAGRIGRGLHGFAERDPGRLARQIVDAIGNATDCIHELRIRPAGRPITGALHGLAACSPSFLAEGREQDEQLVRESL